MMLEYRSVEGIPIEDGHWAKLVELADDPRRRRARARPEPSRSRPVEGRPRERTDAETPERSVTRRVLADLGPADLSARLPQGQGRPMRAGEGGDHLGQRGQVEVDQAADGVVVVEDVAHVGERAEAGRAVAEFGGGRRSHRPDR